jgi:CRISPR-associated protein Csx14
VHKISIIAPLGTSPPVVTEFLQYVQESMFESVTDLTLIATKEQAVLEGLELIKVAVKRRYPKVHVHIVELPFTDIASEADHLEFMKICAKILKDQRDVHRADKVYLCVAGGRKDMCITLSLLAQYFGVNGVFHVIMPNVKAFSSELERMRYEISELARAGDKEAYYQAKAERFDELMYPPIKSYITIRIPIIPIPQNIIYDVIKILKAKKVERKDVDLPISFLKDLEASNIIRLTKNFILIEDVGYNILEALGEAI